MPPIERIRSGIRNLDNMMEGGFIKNRVYMISGPPGCGKTTFGMQFLVEGAKLEERALYVTTIEDPKNIVVDMSRYNFDVIDHYKAKRIFFLDLSETKFEASSSVPRSQFVIQKIVDSLRGMNVSRIVIDSFSSIKFAAEDEKSKKRETDVFTRALGKLGATVLLISEMSDSREYAPEHFSTNGLIYLHHFLHKKEMVRAMQVMKMRGTNVDTNMIEMAFSPDGLMTTGRKILQE